ALNNGIAGGAIDILTEEIPVKIEDLAQKIHELRKSGKEHFVIVVSEGYGHSVEVAKKIEELTGIETKATILGHVQRGGTPTLRDRVLASQMGHRAVELFDKGIGNRIVAVRKEAVVDIDIDEALAMKKGLDMDKYKVLTEIAL
ncbi:MAG TPA: 6-phosphofructokinase, partial [Ruminiclostridium sp.]|nr:6-phosphofructokinase [Ruminiclostridium sp.]